VQVCDRVKFNILLFIVCTALNHVIAATLARTAAQVVGHPIGEKFFAMSIHCYVFSPLNGVLHFKFRTALIGMCYKSDLPM
jgi:hypothetical protein